MITLKKSAVNISSYTAGIILTEAIGISVWLGITGYAEILKVFHNIANTRPLKKRGIIDRCI
jgi:hypothetical protein